MNWSDDLDPQDDWVDGPSFYESGWTALRQEFVRVALFAAVGFAVWSGLDHFGHAAKAPANAQLVVKTGAIQRPAPKL